MADGKGMFNIVFCIYLIPRSCKEIFACFQWSVKRFLYRADCGLAVVAVSCSLKNDGYTIRFYLEALSW